MYYILKILNYIKLYFLLAKILIKRECYIGPFVGEFGHLLSHIVPFISFLYSKGVKVNYCGPAIHRVFFYDNKKKFMLNEFYSLRDFYQEITPFCNDQNYPEDVGVKINNFIYVAQKSNFPFLDLRERFFYFDCFCRWQYNNKFVKIFPIERNLKDKKFRVSLFPSKKKTTYTKYRGEDWDYKKVIKTIESYVDEIFILGHPAFSIDIKESGKIKKFLTSDNTKILDKCLNSDLIITQMSGVHYLGLYSNTTCMILLKGSDLNLSNLNKDISYRNSLSKKQSLIVVNNYNSIKNFITKNKKI